MAQKPTTPRNNNNEQQVEIDALRENLAALQAENAAFNEANVGLNTQLEESNARIDELQEAVNKAQARIVELEHAQPPADQQNPPAPQPPSQTAGFPDVEGNTMRCKVIVYKHRASIGRILAGDIVVLPVNEARDLIAQGMVKRA
ncbi:MAG: hypothetical protein AAGD43_06815 [Pseudomonadota bacterium]